MNKKRNAMPKVMFGMTLFALLLFSCKTNNDAQQVKQEIKAAIDYANAPSYVLFVTAEEGTGTITLGGGNQSLKVTDSFNVEFQSSQDYKFIKWIAVDKNNQSLSRENYVTFSNSQAQQTRITLNYACNDIVIKPYCLSYLKVTDFSPEYKENGVGYNTPVKIDFSDYIDEWAFSFTTEEIKNLDLAATDLLKAQTFEGTEYVYGYQKNGRIFYKNIEITTAGGAAAITQYFEPPVVINGKTLYLALKSEYYDVLTADLEADTTKEITVTLASSIFDTRGMSFADGYSNLSFKYAINNQIIAETPSAQVFFTTQGSKGKILPQGETTVYTELSYPLVFTPDSADYFEHWGIFYASNGEELPYADEILQIEDLTKQETSFVLTMALPGIMVKPVCKERPVVYLTSPNSDNAAAHSDISVLFSHSMLTEDLRWRYSDIKDAPVQRELRDTNKEIYGYVSHGGEHVWKNIIIESSTGENLLSYFKWAEYVENGTKLTIVAEPGKTLASGTVVFVKINKSIRDSQGIPCGSDNEYIEFTYQVQ